MNRIGRNKTVWLLKQECQFVDEIMPGTEEKVTAIYTKQGEYICLADLGERADVVNFIFKHRLTQLSSIERAKGMPLEKNRCIPASIGYNEKEKAWYGWTHRGHGRFYVGYQIVKGSIMDKGDHKYPFRVRALKKAKQLAIEIVEELR